MKALKLIQRGKKISAEVVLIICALFGELGWWSMHENMEKKSRFGRLKSVTPVDFPLSQIRKEIGEWLLAESTTEFWVGFSYFHLIMEETSWLN